MEETSFEYNEKGVAIVDVAERLFAKDGFEATSVRDIAKEADVNIAMISYYFGSKKNLLTAIVARHANRIRILLEALVANEKLSNWEKVESLIESFVNKYFLQEDFHKIVAREQLRNEASELRNMLFEMKKKNQQVVQRLISDGQKAGDFKKNVDIPMLMCTMIGTVNHLMSVQHFYKDINNLQHLSEEDFQKNLKKKLNLHLKFIFKAILNNDK